MNNNINTINMNFILQVISIELLDLQRLPVNVVELTAEAIFLLVKKFSFDAKGITN